MIPSASRPTVPPVVYIISMWGLFCLAIFFEKLGRMDGRTDGNMCENNAWSFTCRDCGSGRGDHWWHMSCSSSIVTFSHLAFVVFYSVGKGRKPQWTLLNCSKVGTTVFHFQAHQKIIAARQKLIIWTSNHVLYVSNVYPG